MDQGKLVTNISQKPDNFAWFLGASTSRMSGLPTATDLIWDLKVRQYCKYENQNISDIDIRSEQVRVRDEHGQEQSLSKTDPMLKHVTYAYSLTADRAQGQTYDAAVTILSSRQGEMASNARAYVMACRPRDDLVLVTDNAKELFRSLAEHGGMNRIALEHVVEDAKAVIHERDMEINMPLLTEAEAKKAGNKALGQNDVVHDERDKKELQLVMPPFNPGEQLRQM